MGKKAFSQQLADNEATAIASSIRISPRKLGLIAGLIRGKNVDQALSDLTF